MGSAIKKRRIAGKIVDKFAADPLQTRMWAWEKIKRAHKRVGAKIDSGKAALWHDPGQTMGLMG